MRRGLAVALADTSVDPAAYAHVAALVHAPKTDVEHTTSAQPANDASIFITPSLLVIPEANTHAAKATTHVLDFGASSKVVDSVLALDVALGASPLAACVI